MVRWRRFYEKAWPIRFKRGCVLTFSCFESMRMMKKETKSSIKPKLDEIDSVEREADLVFAFVWAKGSSFVMHRSTAIIHFA